MSALGARRAGSPGEGTDVLLSREGALRAERRPSVLKSSARSGRTERGLAALADAAAERRAAAEREHAIIAELRDARVPWRRIAFAVRRGRGERCDVERLGERLRKQHERWRTTRPPILPQAPGHNAVAAAACRSEDQMTKTLIRETTTTTKDFIEEPDEDEEEEEWECEAEAPDEEPPPATSGGTP